VGFKEEVITSPLIPGAAKQYHQHLIAEIATALRASQLGNREAEILPA
jgi:hypothetical protein